MKRTPIVIVVLALIGAALPVFWIWGFVSAYRDAKRFPHTVAADCHGLIEAVYRYRHEVGAWPPDLEALVPQYLERLPKVHDSYHAPVSGVFTEPVLTIGGPMHGRVEYVVPPGTPPPQHWTASWDWSAGQPIPSPTPIRWPK